MPKLAITPVSREQLRRMSGIPPIDGEALDFIKEYRLVFNPSTCAYDTERTERYVYITVDERVLKRNGDGFTIRFGKIEGTFDCSDKGLVSLKNAPLVVTEGFHCEKNKLKTLEFSPKKVYLDFTCYNNGLETLFGAPQRIGRHFHCEYNHLKTLEHAPNSVCGDFSCVRNELESLEGSPTYVGGDFRCDWNKLKSLKSTTETIVGSLYCTSNELETLQHTPIRIGKNIVCYKNPLKSIELRGTALGFLGSVIAIDPSEFDPPNMIWSEKFTV